MTAVEVENKLLGKSVTAEREIGKYTTGVSGPTVVCLAGIHGNEPAGVFALDHVFEVLNRAKPRIRGELIGICGNPPALSQGKRFIDEDLNRIWLPERIDKIKSDGVCRKKETVEYVQQRDLLYILENIFENSREKVYTLDLHTTSAESVPFMTVGGALIDKSLALEFGVPVVVGIDDFVKGTLLSYIRKPGVAVLGFEAGQHASPSSIRNNAAAVWITLAYTGCINPEDIPELTDYLEALHSSEGERGIYEVKFRYELRDEEDFLMEPGFENFKKIEEGDLIARNQYGEIRAPVAGRILMPLYQRQGNDGFFIVSKVDVF